MGLSVQEIADFLGAKFVGAAATTINTVAPLDKATADSISFLSSPKYRAYLQQSTAGAVLVTAKHAADSKTTVIIVDNPYLAYARVCTLLHPAARSVAMIHPTAILAEGVELAEGISLGPNVVVEQGVKIGNRCRVAAGCYLGENVVLGNDCVLDAGVRVYHESSLGDRVRVQANTTIGSDGFGYAEDRGAWVKIPQLGRVLIGNDVEIGANTCIDRGALDDTVIENGVILDNLVQVAHNVKIGAHTAIAGCVGIAGSAQIGRYCRIGGATTVLGHLSICDHVSISAMSLVSQSIAEPGSYASGAPLQASPAWRRSQARYKQLDQLTKRITELEKKAKADDKIRHK